MRRDRDNITCSAVAPSTVLRAGWLSYGRCDFSTPHSSAPNEAIIMKFCTCDYVMETTPLANFYHPTSASLPPGMGWNITSLCPSLFFCLCFHLHAMRRDELADFHDLCVKWRHSVEGCAFWGLELHFTPFGGRLPPKTAPKRPSKGKFKPKLKIREFELNFVIEDQSSPNFINVCRNIVCIRP